MHETVRFQVQHAVGDRQKCNNCDNVWLSTARQDLVPAIMFAVATIQAEKIQRRNFHKVSVQLAPFIRRGSGQIFTQIPIVQYNPTKDDSFWHEAGPRASW